MRSSSDTHRKNFEFPRAFPRAIGNSGYFDTITVTAGRDATGLGSLVYRKRLLGRTGA